MKKVNKEPFELPEDIEKYAFSWEIWLLKLDKCLDAEYRKKTSGFGRGFKIGASCAVILFTCLHLINLHHKVIHNMMLAPVFISISIVIFQNELYFRPRNVRLRYFDKKEDLGCNRIGLPEFGDPGWISKRLIRHYPCNILPIWNSANIGWVVTTLPLLLLNNILTN